MWSDILWPFAVVLFEVLVFVITLYLVHRYAHSHDAEWKVLESYPSAPIEASTRAAAAAQAAETPVRTEREQEQQAAPGREPVGVA